MGTILKLIMAVFILAALQIKVGQLTIESHLEHWARHTGVAGYAKEAALGATQMTQIAKNQLIVWFSGADQSASKINSQTKAVR